MPYLLTIDQGTTSSRAIVFSEKGELLAQHQLTLASYFPKPGWVEQSPLEMWLQTFECCKQVLKQNSIDAKEVVGLGITNQRETTLIWNRQTGEPIYPAIVWQDRRTADYCKELGEKLPDFYFQTKTGLLLDPYFSATKIIWILDHVPNARKAAEAGELAFGTVDTYLLWKLTNGQVHATDATNASRTLLFNIHAQKWDEAILKLFNIPRSLLPEVKNSSDHFGYTSTDFFGKSIAIRSVMGDQQAALVGQACFKTGMIKSTYGTGAFMLLNTGATPVFSKNRLLTTIAYRLEGKVTYGLEASLFSCGVVIKWLRDQLKIIKRASETEKWAESIATTDGVYFVPAFTGLGAPYWNPDARAAIMGLTQNSSTAHIVRSALESIGYQTKDTLIAMVSDLGGSLSTLRVDGGMVANKWLLQFLSDILQLEIQLPRYVETTALGVAYFTGLQAGFFDSLEAISRNWEAKEIFSPKMSHDRVQTYYAGWQKAVAGIITS